MKTEYPYPPLDKFLAMMNLYEAQWQDVVCGPGSDIYRNRRSAAEEKNRLWYLSCR